MQIRGIDVTPAQADVYRIMKSHGRAVTDAALVPLVQHMAGAHWSSSGIRTRRAELARKGLVRESIKTVTMPSGRKARTFLVS